MGKTMKKILCSLLVAVMCLTSAPVIGFDFTAEAAEYKVGDIIQFGSYPQTEVKDEALVAELNALAPQWEDWTSYGYYSGTGDYGTMVQGDWMRYTDATYNGNKYRGVKFTQYRPYFTLYPSSSSYTHQVDNEYSTNTVYWFKFEPIDWRVLDSATGLVMCETIIDAQPYSNTIYYNSSANSVYGYFNDSSYTNYASDYETSSIRKWLNEDFYNTAFTDSEKKEINTATLNNDSYSTLVGTTLNGNLDSNETKDKIFLLSYNEVRNSKFGFNSSDSANDTARFGQGSDYAQSQGLFVYRSSDNNYNGNSYWFLRSPGLYSHSCCEVDGYGCSISVFSVYNSHYGIRPAMKLNLSSEKEEYETGDIIQFGSYPQTEVKDEALVAELNALAPQWEDWTSYGYYSGTGEGIVDGYGTMVQGDWMRYTDVTYNGNKYRAVKFIQYRPEYTSCDFYTYTIHQLSNDYHTNAVYWFKFDSIDWRVLDPVTGFVMCETIIDAQPYSNTIYENGGGAYGNFNDSSHTNYASDYETSSIRQWLNEDFYNTAFTDSEKKKINTTTLNNDGYYTSIGIEGYEKLDSNETEDKIFLLSYDEVINSKFGFSSSYLGDDTARFGQGSDYAKCQGLAVYEELGSIYNGNSYWNLRSPGDWSESCCFVDGNGYAGPCFGNVNNTSLGIRPALRLNEWPEISQPEHTCNYISKITKQPTHLEYGEMTYTCEGCGDTYTEKLDILSEHILLIEEREATCFDPGYVRYFCECGYNYFESYTEALGHNYIRKVITEPTHLEYGEIAYICERCGDSYREKLDKLTEHTYVAVETKPTCTEDGYVTYICECGDYYIDGYVEAPGHIRYSEIIKQPTHLEYGEVAYICKACGDSYREKLEKLQEHTYLEVITKPTCTEKGFVTNVCECGDNYVAYYIDELRHDYYAEITTAPTHLEYGEITYTCKECGDSYREKLEKLQEHTYLEIITEPTCTEKGFVTYICKCGDSYDDSYIDELGHEYHQYTTKEATHIEYGELTYKCVRGDYSYTEVIDKLKEHNYEEIVTSPTCNDKGYTTYVCECGDFYVDDYVDALGHVYTSKITTPATHLGEGEMTYTCDCGDSYTKPIARLDEHSYKAVVTAPTCTEKGFTAYTCECGDTYVSDYVDAIGHSDNNTDGVCDVCGYDFREDCDCGCHKSGIAKFFFNFILFFQKLFKKNQICEGCGAAHY